MGYIQEADRNQVILMPDILDDYVGSDNEVRVIDAFIDSLDIASMGFKANSAKEGRPGYDPRDMLKLYMYGYLNHIRSSRRLQKFVEIPKETGVSEIECRLNRIEVAEKLFKDSGSAIKWGSKACNPHKAATFPRVAAYFVIRKTIAPLVPSHKRACVASGAFHIERR